MSQWCGCVGAFLFKFANNVDLNIEGSVAILRKLLREIFLFCLSFHYPL